MYRIVLVKDKDDGGIIKVDLLVNGYLTARIECANVHIDTHTQRVWFYGKDSMGFNFGSFMYDEIILGGDEVPAEKRLITTGGAF